MAGLVSTGLSILQWNCCGLLAHHNELRQFLSSSSVRYDIICLQETFLKPGKQFHLQGYSTARKDRLDSRGGGVVTLVRDTVNYVELDTSSIDLEMITIKVKTNNSYVYVVNLYIAPNTEVNCNTVASVFSPNTIVVGDLNSHNPIWGSPRTDDRGLMIENIVNDNNFTVLNNGQPTYLHYDGTRTHLDLCLVCHTLATKTVWDVIDSNLGSDHFPTVTLFNDIALYEDPDRCTRFNLSKADWASFKNNARDLVTPDLISDTSSASEAAERLTHAIITSAELSIPKQKARLNSKFKPLPYWSEKCRKAIKDRNKARNVMCRNKTVDSCINYRKLKGKAQYVIKSAARDHWQDYCSTLNSSTKLSSVWRMAKKMSGTHNSYKIKNLSHNGSTVETDQDKAELFAKTFSEVSSNSNYSAEFQLHKNNIENNFSYLFDNTPADTVSSNGSNNTLKAVNEPFDMHELKRVIRETKKNSAPGIDQISYEMLQKLPKTSLKTTLQLYNHIWTKNDFPVSWRHSIVNPVLKAGKDPSSTSSYRPISLTSTLCKVLEKLVTNRLTYHVEKNNILNNLQCGFRKGRSTIDHIIRLQDTIHKYNNNKGFTVAVFLDFTSAFDMMWRSGLLIKLRSYGITGNVFNFIRNFLTDRTLQVKVGGCLSSSYSVVNGTAQGSIISPLLFLLMINDLPAALTDVECSLFADDSCIYKSGSNLPHLVNKIQENLNYISEWCNQWGFKISLDKTIAVAFTHKRDNNISLHINKNPIKVENKAKFLGLIFDSRLTWNDHIKYTVDKCNKRLNLMRAVAGNAWGASKKTLLLIYRSLIRSIIEYGSIAYDSAADRIKRKLDMVHHKALRIACGAFPSTPVAALEVECGELPLALRRSQAQHKYALKVINTAQHPAKSITSFHWTVLSSKFTPNKAPFYTKTNRYLNQSRDNFIAVPKIPENPPWLLKPCNIDIDLTKLGRKDENPELLRNLALGKIDFYHDTTQIFTDGSKTIDHKVSAAFFVPEQKVEYSVRLTDKVTIFAAELTAIKLSLRWAITTAHQNITIFSDSLSALQAIDSGKTHNRPNLLLEVQELITQHAHSITMVWLPSHLGIKGNEAADRLANSATSHSSVDIDIGFELSESYQQVDNHIMDIWQDRWSKVTKALHYHEIVGTVSSKVKYTHTSRRKEVIITRLRLGKCRLNHYLYEMSKHHDGFCSVCQVPETISHFLLECPTGETCSAVLEACKNLQLTPTLHNILNNTQIHNIILTSLHRPI